MLSPRDYSVCELGRTRLALRKDLVFTPQTFGGEAFYTIEDPTASKFYRIGLAEYTFISLLDGRTPVAEALAQTARHHPVRAINESEAAAICQWLIEMNLASTAQSALPDRLCETAVEEAKLANRQVWNPLYLRFPLFRPDRFFDRVTPWLGWLYSSKALALWVLLVGFGSYQVVSQWGRFVSSAQGILAPNNWFWLGLCWIVLKVVHELSHGIVCKKYGGTVRETGVILIMLAPVAYVDVTSSWRFRSKWQRIHTAVAGVYIELLVAALASAVWIHARPGPLSAFCFNTILMASLTTVLFNANPLTKFDGYYVLSDLLEIPNLYTNGQTYLRYLAKRYIFGVPATIPHWSIARSWLIKVYGLASLVWRVVFCTGLLVVASTYFHGAGIVLSVLAGAAWLVVPAIQFVRYMLGDTPGEKPSLQRFAWVSLSALGTITFVFTLLPWPGSIRAPAVVDYTAPAVVRTDSPGFVRELRVRPGEMVEEGQVLVVLSNEELSRDLGDLVLAQEQSRIKLRTHEKNNHMAAFQAESETLESLEKKHREKQSQVDSLVLRAPCGGMVIGHHLEELLGRYIKAGTEVLSIGDETSKELRLSIPQQDLDAFTAELAHPVRVRTAGFRRFDTVLARIHPSAGVDLLHPALAAPNGGPIAVRAKSRSPEEPNRSDTAYEFVEPRFVGILELDREQSRPLRVGQLGVVSIRPGTQTVGGHLYRVFHHWLQKTLRRHTGQDSYH